MLLYAIGLTSRAVLRTLTPVNDERESQRVSKWVVTLNGDIVAEVSTEDIILYTGASCEVLTSTSSRWFCKET